MTDGICQAWVSNRIAVASVVAASSTGRSVSNQVSACWSSAKCSGTVPVATRVARAGLSPETAPGCTVGGVQVVVEHSVRGAVPGLDAVVDVGLFTGVGAQEVVEAVPARKGFGQKVRVAEFREDTAGLTDLDRGETGRCRDADIRTRMHTQ